MTILRKTTLAAALLAMGGLMGCEEPANGPGSDPAQKNGDDASTTSNQASEKTPLKVASWDEVQKAVASHQGKVVVLDLWSSSCTPCIKELPGLAKLHEQHAGDVVCLTLNLDYIGLPDEPPQSHVETAGKILADKGIKCRSFVSSTPDEEIYKQLDAAAVPIVLVYDREGKLAKRFDNDTSAYGDEGFTYAQHIAPLVTDLLAGTGS
jgi:thiol-disulfide isomerase/thioredoxin